MVPLRASTTGFMNGLDKPISLAILIRHMSRTPNTLVLVIM
jgi:hypothetical protein